MARIIDPDNENDVRNAIAEFRTIVHESRDRGKLLILDIKEENKEPTGQQLSRPKESILV